MTRIPSLPPNETLFLAQMFDQDAKNYHVWSYRQWLVRHFSLWDSELPYINSLLDADVRNNSAWNHRWFVIFARHTDPNVHRAIDHHHPQAPTIRPEIIERELTYAKTAIARAPQNQSPWNYLRGVLKHQGTRFEELQAFAEGFADVDREDEVRSSHALDFLAEVYAGRELRDRAGKALELLAKRYDPIRKNYWNYRRGLLGLREVEVEV